MNNSDATKLARRFIDLPREKRQIFLEGLKKEGLDFGLFPIVSNVDTADRYALSYAQQRMWFLWQLDPQSAAYNLPSAVRLNGALDLAALNKAFDSLISRHETLRMCFRQIEGDDPIQHIEAAMPVTIIQEDLSDLSEAEQEQQAERKATEESLLPFDLIQGPLLRVKLLKLSDKKHVLLLTMHHIIADGWSINVMIDEFIRLYDAYSLGSDANLEPLPIQYVDYALWQRRWLEAGELQRQLGYWQNHLGDNHPILELPTDHPRPLSPSYLGSRHEFIIDAKLTKSLRTLSQENNVTLFMLLLAAFKILLYRYTGQSDLRVGVPIANRNRAETEGLIGCFINTQVLRTVLDGQATVSELLQSVRNTALGAQAHQDLPFEKLVDSLNLERSLSHNALFQVMYSHQAETASIEKVSTQSGLQLSQLDWDTQVTQFDLTLDVNEHAEDISASFNYAVDLFDATTIERMAAHWEQLLKSIVADVHQTINTVTMLGKKEHQQLLHGWNHLEIPTTDLIPAYAYSHLQIEAQADLTPDAIALIFEQQQLTFSEMNNWVNQVAVRLREKSVKPGMLVGIAVNRGMEMVIGLLAILKSGAGYVPLDPQYPTDRLAYMIDDSGIELLLIQPTLMSTVPVPEGLATLSLDADFSWQEQENISIPIHPDNLAYVIYTSGSTGKPKGVAISHSALNSHVNVAVDYFELTTQDRVLLFSSLNFDGFVEQLFPALCIGAGVVIRGNDVWDSETFYQESLRTNLTVADLSTAYWHMLVQDFAQIGPRDYGKLRQISATGEAMPPQGINAWRQAGLEQIRLLNTYGPTETTVTATYLDCEDYVTGKRDLPTMMPIGKGLAGRAMYVLDSGFMPTPVGVTGELYIGGELLARGYHGRADLTAERFIPDPFSNIDGARMYNTGDLAYYRADGVIEYVGRSDFQVKIRGFRIELGEIEAQLQAYEGLRDAVVLVQEGVRGQQLVAYLVPDNNKIIEADADVQSEYQVAVKQYLQEVMPDYMVPTQFMLLESMPLTPTGKLDRNAFPKVDIEQNQQEYIAARNDTEITLVNLWKDILEVDQIGVTDSFFAIGGHSLLMVRLVTKIKQAFAIDLPLKDFYLSTVTIETMALAIAEQQHSNEGNLDLIFEALDELENIGNAS